MSKYSKVVVFIAVLGITWLGGLLAQQPLIDNTRATGAIRLTAEQLEKVLTTWPRVDRVNFNRIGRERVNRVKALKGETPLPLSAVKAIGRETESSIHPAGTPDMPIILNEDLTGALPVYVDNSTDSLTGLHFPPIRDQGSLGSCAAWASTYYQLSYMTALQRGLDIRNSEDNTNKYSPKWSYNLLNAGANSGSSLANILTLIQLHGAVTWAEFPYDTDYLAWCLNTNAWRNALSVRTEPAQFSWHTDTNAGLEVIKQLLANGYVLTYNTDIYAWHLTLIPDNPSTTDDTPAVGKAIGYWVDTTASGHSMTIVGYNDSIWTDINGNGTIDTGELGALRIANSWGPDWHPGGAPADGGFIWLAYDALKGVSAVPGGPSTGREAAFWDNLAYVQTPRDNYSPSLIAEFTVNHLKRNQLTLSLGVSDTTRTTPSTTWTPIAFYQQGGAYAFDGTTIACDGTFVLDFTDILAWATGGVRRFYLKMADSTSGDQATMSAFKIIDYTTDPDTEVVCASVPQYADATTVNPYVEHTYTGPTRNTLPVLSNGYVTPASGTDLSIFNFLVYYLDADGPSAVDPPVRNVYIDGTAHQMTYVPNGITRSSAWYQFTTTLPVGNHNYRFFFTDVNGGSGQDPITTDPPDYYTYEGPAVILAHIVTTPSTPTGQQNPIMGLPYTYPTSGSACHQGHSIQYQFDWGDGTTSDWLAVGVTSVQHTWSSSGIFSVKAHARCTENNAILSSWSSGLQVNVAVSSLLSQSFPGSTFPTGWTQQNIGTSNAWNINNTNNAGGLAYETRCSWTAGTGTTRLVTPPIDTTGRSTLFLSFKHFYDGFMNPGPQILVQTSPDGTNWTNEAWVVTPTNVDIGPETVNTTLTHNLNITTTRVAFTVIGSLSSMNYWYIDDVSIGAGALQAKRKVDFDKDGQEDLLWRCYGTGYRQGDNVVWFMTQTGALAPATLGGAQNRVSGMNLLTQSAPTKTYLTPMIGNVRTSGPGKSYVSPMAVGNLQAAGPTRSFVSPVDVGNLSAPGQKKLPRGAVDSSRGLSRGNGAQIRGRELKDNPISQDAEKLVEGDIGYSDANLYTVLDTAWEIAGAGDFDGDGNTDILWRYYGAGQGQGTTIIWYMTGTTISSQGYPYQVSDTDWRIDRTGDFNGDGKTDILWRYYGTGPGQGTTIIWYMNGANVIGQAYPPQVWDTNWKIEGIGDFNGDGKADLLWRYYGTGPGQGTTIIWYMDGATIIGQDRPYLISDTDWRVDAVGDFDGDGKADIVWRYYGTVEAPGMTFIWYMNGAMIKAQDCPYRVPDLNWRIVNR